MSKFKFERGDFITPIENIRVPEMGGAVPGDIFMVHAVSNDLLSLMGEKPDSPIIMDSSLFRPADRKFKPGDRLTCLYGGFGGLKWGKIYTVDEIFETIGDVLHLTTMDEVDHYNDVRVCGTRFMYRKSNNPDNPNDVLSDDDEPFVGEQPIRLIETVTVHSDSGEFAVASSETSKVHESYFAGVFFTDNSDRPANNVVVVPNGYDGDYRVHTFVSTEPLWLLRTYHLRNTDSKSSTMEKVLLEVKLSRSEQPISASNNESGEIILTECERFAGSVV